MRVHKFLLALLAGTLVGCLDSEERVIEEKNQGLVYNKKIKKKKNSK